MQKDMSVIYASGMLFSELGMFHRLGREVVLSLCANYRGPDP